MLIPRSTDTESIKNLAGKEQKALAVFGSTGSIGLSTLSLVRENPQRFSVRHLVAGSNVVALAEQAAEFRPAAVGIHDASKASELRDLLSARNITAAIAVGSNEIADLVDDTGIDLLVAGIVGIAGLRSVHRAVARGLPVALANKESLVCGGAVLSKIAEKSGGVILPVDSEHSALFQALNGEQFESVDKLILTASGGPFLTTPLSELRGMKASQALKHPRWSMGAKVTIDSSTMFNKALELIEASWLFGVPEGRISVLVHPQSIVHSLVSFVDGTQVAQLSHPDMRGAIAYALSYPGKRLAHAVRSLDLSEIGSLEFRALDREKFPAVGLAREVLRSGGSGGVVFNAANEVAVEWFLQDRIGYTDIFPIVADTVEAMVGCRSESLEDILELDRQVRLHVSEKHGTAA